MALSETCLSFLVDETHVSSVFLRPAQCRHGLVLAHGAGAGMRHAFLEDFSQALAQRDIATLRYQFPYMEGGKRFPDPQPKLVNTVASAIRCFTSIASDLHCVAGGKSMGGRMSSLALAKLDLVLVHGLVFLGFPLHPPKKPGTQRAQHLSSITKPMLFLQGTRDNFGTPDLLNSVIEPLQADVTLVWIESGDHSFKVLKSSNMTPEDVMGQLADTTSSWIKSVCPKHKL